MRSDTLAIRDRLLAVLREASQPLTTSDVCDQAGPYVEVHECQGRHPSLDNPWYRLMSCDGGVDTIAVHLSAFNRGYIQLRALEGKGQVRRIRVREQRSVYWAAVESVVDEELAELEAIWEASS